MKRTPKRSSDSGTRRCCELLAKAAGSAGRDRSCCVRVGSTAGVPPGGERPRGRAPRLACFLTNAAHRAGRGCALPRRGAAATHRFGRGRDARGWRTFNVGSARTCGGQTADGVFVVRLGEARGDGSFCVAEARALHRANSSSAFSAFRCGCTRLSTVSCRVPLATRSNAWRYLRQTRAAAMRRAAVVSQRPSACVQNIQIDWKPRPSCNRRASTSPRRASHSHMTTRSLPTIAFSAKSNSSFPTASRSCFMLLAQHRHFEAPEWPPPASFSIEWSSHSITARVARPRTSREPRRTNCLSPRTNARGRPKISSSEKRGSVRAK